MIEIKDNVSKEITTNSLQELGRRMVACKHWRWMDGMLVLRYAPGKLDDMKVEGRANKHRSQEYELWGSIPDLSDPATLGCLLALVRESWKMPTGISVVFSDDEGIWKVHWSGSTHGGCCGQGITEAEALVEALENTP